MSFKNRLKEARLNKKLTQERLGELIGVAKSTITGYEKGNSEPDMMKLQKLMVVLDVDANFLLQDEMISPPIDKTLSQGTIEVAWAYEKASFKEKNIVRQVLDLEPLEYPSTIEASTVINKKMAV